MIPFHLAKSKRSVATVLFFSFLCAFVPADELDDAAFFETSGDRRAAAAAYGKWLSMNPGHERAASILLHAASIHESPLEALLFLSEYAGVITQPQSSRVYARMAGLESLLGLLSDAAEHYELAAGFGTDESDLWLLEAATLRLSMGESDRSRTMASEIAARARNGVIKDEAAAVAALAAAAAGRPDEALNEIEGYLARREIPDSPLPYLALERIAAAAGSIKSAAEARAGLLEYFEGSAALYLAERKILEWTTPAALLRARTTSSGSPVQVGAFRGRDGAASLRERLENDGFVSWMESGDGLWRVYVNNPDGNAASRLAASGYSVLVPAR